MKLVFEKKKEITSFKQWEKLGHPKDPQKQWVKGRSSWEMATYAIDHKKVFKEHLEKILNECGIVKQDFICEPESTSGLGQGMKQGGPRNHDLLMIGSKDCVIGVEAKVSEGFDDSLYSNIEKQKQPDKTIEETRGYQLFKYLTCDKKLEDVEKIGYQLFTATRAVINEANKQKKNNSILLIIVFTGDDDVIKKEDNYSSKCQKNDSDLTLFKKAIGTDNNDMITRTIGKNEINCWIKKIKVHLPDYKIEY